MYRKIGRHLKENMLEELELGELEFLSVEDFLGELEREFEGGDNELAKGIKNNKGVCTGVYKSS